MTITTIKPNFQNMMKKAKTLSIRARKFIKIEYKLGTKKDKKG